MFKIQTLNTISNNGLEQFPRAMYEVASELHDPDALLLRSYDLHHWKIPASVKVIGRAGAGVNNIPVAALTKQGIPVLNTPGANANAVRELVIAGMLMASRNIFPAWNYMNALECSAEELDSKVEQEKKHFAGFELMGKTVGIIGLGSIGVKVANAAIGLGMQVIGYDPTITVTRAWELSSQVKQARSIDDLLMESDFISFHVPLTEETRHMINVSRLRLVKPNAVLLNFARDGIIDNQALLEALNEKKIYAYVTDFPQLSFLRHPRVIALPHLGASTKEAEENCAVMIVKQVRDFLETGNITNSVNFPMVDVALIPNATRLAIVNQNVPNMVAQISAKVAQVGLNIVTLTNKSRDEIAYTMLDVNEKVQANVLQQIAEISGVLQVRQIIG